MWEVDTVGCHLSVLLNFYLEMFPFSNEFPNSSKQASRNTMDRISLSHCRGCRVSLEWVSEYGEVVEWLHCPAAQGVGRLGMSEVISFNKDGPMRKNRPCHLGQAGDLQVTDA